MSHNWERLPSGRHETCPPLFFSYNPHSKGYELYVTDLVHVWTESLNHKQVLGRASRDDASIDPSEDDDQFSVLLQKVGDALTGDKGTELSLNRSKEENSFKLKTSTKLPSPLEPLEWQMDLSMLPQNALTKQILLPILRGEADRAARQQSLIDLLKEKDWALSKVFEKIESSGLDLTRAFPGLGGSRAGQRGSSALAQVSKVIKGTATFDEKAWDSSFADQKSDQGLGVYIATELDNTYSYREWDAVEANLDNWWVRLGSPGSTGNKVKGRSKEKSPEPRTQRAPEKQDLTESDDEFQRQSTPPHLKQTRPSAPRYERDEAHTTHSRKAPDESMATESDESPSPALPRQKSTAPKGLGTIGSGSKKQKSSKDDELTESESDESRTPVKSRKKEGKSNGLGRIGGRKSQLATRQQQLSTEATTSGSTGPGEGKLKAPDEEVLTASDSEGEPKPRVQPKGTRETTEDGVSDDERVGDTETIRKKPRATVGLGQIGGKKHKEEMENQKKRKSPSVQDIDEEGDTEGQQDAGYTSGTGHEKARQASSSKSKAPGKLGMIGAKTKQTPKQKESDENKAFPPKSQRDAEETESGSEEESTEKVEKKPKKESPSEKPTLSQPQSPTGPQGLGHRSAWPKEDGKKESKEETAEERANRKRQELRQQLETKGPAKKKRKF